MLRETKINIEFNELIGRELLIETDFQAPFETQFATFDPHSLIVNGFQPFIQSDGLPIEIDAYCENMKKTLETLPDDPSRFALLMKDTSWMHEYKHFHDSICTPMGYRLFMEEWDMWRRIFNQLIHYKENGNLIRKPLVVGANENIKPYVDLFESISSYRLFRIINNGDITLKYSNVSPNDYDVAWLEIGSENNLLKIPCFPGTHNPKDLSTSVLVPIGFRAITEAGAVLFQVNIIRSFGKKYADMFLKRLRNNPEYTVINQLFTRVLKTHYKSQYHSDNDNRILFSEHGEGDLFKLLNATLSFDPSDKNQQPGEILVHLLMDGFDSREGRILVPYSSNLERYKEFKNKMLNNDDPEEFNNKHFFYQMYTFVKKCIDDTIEIHLEKKHRDIFALDSLDWYSCFNYLLPNPPLSIQGMDIGYSKYFGEDEYPMYLFAVLGWIMFKNCIEQAMVNWQIVCPLHFKRYTALKKLLIKAKICKENNEGLDCGSVDLGEQLLNHRDCPWKLTMLIAALAE